MAVPPAQRGDRGHAGGCDGHPPRRERGGGLPRPRFGRRTRGKGPRPGGAAWGIGAAALGWAACPPGDQGSGGHAGLAGYRVSCVVICWTMSAAWASHFAYAVGNPEACTPWAACHSGWCAQPGFSVWYLASAPRNASAA
jgi:hypothetical protein